MKADLGTIDVVDPALIDEPAVVESPDEHQDDNDRHRRVDWVALGRATGRFLLAVLGALALFSVFMWAKGVNPFGAYQKMFQSTFTSWKDWGEILIRSAPVILAALAVCVPARAGLVNVGGEGQLVVGGVASAGVALAVGTSMPGWLTLVLMALAAGLAGAAWSAIAAVLRQTSHINEGVTTLLMNYVALDLMLFLIYDSWKDRNGSGQPSTPPLPGIDRLPFIGSSRVSFGIVIAVVSTLVVLVVLKKTSWGFRLRVVGGNAEAARRAGMRVSVLLISGMAVGGMLAGLGGFVQLAGSEFKLRPGFLVAYGYLGFLASWLARHHPLRVMFAAIALSAIAISGDSLQLDSKLPAASVNILMALILLGVFGFSRKKVTT
jgi:general nucleoside transport system permease protein